MPVVDPFTELGKMRSKSEMDREYQRLLARDHNPFAFLYKGATFYISFKHSHERAYRVQAGLGHFRVNLLTCQAYYPSHHCIHRSRQLCFSYPLPRSSRYHSPSSPPYSNGCIFSHPMFCCTLLGPCQQCQRIYLTNQLCRNSRCVTRSGSQYTRTNNYQWTGPVHVRQNTYLPKTLLRSYDCSIYIITYGLSVCATITVIICV